MKLKLLLVFISVSMLGFADQKTPYAEWSDGTGKLVGSQGGMIRSLNVKIFLGDGKEIKCRIKSVIMLAHGSNIVSKKDVEGTVFDFSEFMTVARPGDRVIAELKEVVTDDDRKRTLFVKDATLSYTIK